MRCKVQGNKIKKFMSFGKMPMANCFLKRKDFKNQRKEYIKNMHRAHPNVDWEKMDAEFRKIRTDKVRQIRQDLFYSGDLNPQKKQTEYK